MRHIVHSFPLPSCQLNFKLFSILAYHQHDVANRSVLSVLTARRLSWTKGE